MQASIGQLTLKIFKQAAMSHQLRYDVDGLILCADGVQLDELLVTKFFHDLSLGEEVLRVHRTLNQPTVYSQHFTTYWQH